MIKKENKKIVLFDAYAILYRAYHALPEFTSSKGEPTGALYGVAAMLIKIINELKPDYLAACYDLPEVTFRKQAYGDYKATRQKTDDQLIAQIERSKEVFQAFNVPIYAAPGFEADDVIATIVEQTKKEEGLQVIIASGDMDTLQLVEGDRVSVYTLKKGLNDTILYNETAALERFGFDPIYLPDYKGLRGDPSDNIIGITGIGEKTATILVKEFGTIEKMYEVLKGDSEKFKELGLTPRIINLLVEGEEEALFSKVLATVRRDAPITFAMPSARWDADFDHARAENLFTELDFRSLLGRLKQLLKKNAPEATDPTTATEEVVEVVESARFKQTAIALWLLNSELTDPTLDDVLSFAKTKDFAEAEKYIFAELKNRDLERVYQDIEQPLVPIIDRAQERGILVDKKYLADLSVKYHEELTGLEKEIYKQAGREFNINSPKQLGEILFDGLKLTVKGLKKTAGGSRSTRESELVKLRDAHPIIESILKYREYQKLVSTYIDNLPAMLDEGGRLHTTLHQTGTSTGRMSSSNPNLQNIPAREGAGAAIRNAFVATPGHKLLALDYSQIEMRILAELSGDEGLIQVFKDGKDVHSSVASRVFGVAESAVTKDMRRQAKVINFGIVYGMGVNALKENLGTTRDEAQLFYDNYFMTFPSIKKYFERVKSDALAKGYTETMFGRRRYFPGLKSPLPHLRAMAERMAINAPIQGTATGDLVKLAMIKVDAELRAAGLADKVHLLLQVHDELIYEVKTEVAEKALGIIKQAMESVAPGQVPLVVNTSVGKRWGEMA